MPSPAGEGIDGYWLRTARRRAYGRLSQRSSAIPQFCKILIPNGPWFLPAQRFSRPELRIPPGRELTTKYSRDRKDVTSLR